MRKLTSLAAVAALFAAAMLFSASSQAMTPGTAPGVKGAAAAIDPVEKTACWRYGWHGWGWYPCYYGGYYPYRYGYYGYGYRPYGYYRPYAYYGGPYGYYGGPYGYYGRPGISFSFGF